MMEEPGAKVRNARLQLLHAARSTNQARLLRAALAEAQRGPVLYVARAPLDALPPPPPSARSKHYLRQLSFLYPGSPAALLEALATLPAWRRAPCALLLDGLDDYCPPCDPRGACGLLAMLLDAAASCERASGESCTLIVSVNESTRSAHLCNLLNELYFQVHLLKKDN